MSASRSSIHRFSLDTYRLNVSHNVFKKVYRAKAPSTQSKTFSYPSELGELCALARVTAFLIFLI